MFATAAAVRVMWEMVVVKLQPKAAAVVAVADSGLRIERGQTGIVPETIVLCESRIMYSFRNLCHTHTTPMLRPRHAHQLTSCDSLALQMVIANKSACAKDMVGVAGGFSFRKGVGGVGWVVASAIERCCLRVLRSIPSTIVALLYHAHVPT